MAPYINSLVKYLSRFEEGGKILLKLGKLVNKVFDISKIVARVSKDDVDRVSRIIRGIALLLRHTGIEYGYLYNDEMYSGVLLYDLGLDDLFKEHASKVYNIFMKYGVKEVITIDPHTTYILRRIYPEYLNNFNINVVNYLELLDKSSIPVRNKLDIEVTIHDPCYYARYESIVEEPRRLLVKEGISVIEADRNKLLTYCCGGPIEAISPKLSSKIAEVRLEKLSNKSRNIVVLCPICYSNLSRVASGDLNVLDISEYLTRVYGK